MTRTTTGYPGSRYSFGVLASICSICANSSGAKVTSAAAAEPRLNAWAALLLGDPASVYVRTDYLGGSDEPDLKAVDVHLADLGLASLDVVYLADAWQGAGQPELEARIAYHLLHISGRPPAARRVRLSLERQPGWPAGAIGLSEYLTWRLKNRIALSIEVCIS